MTQTHTNANLLKNAGVVTTLIDGVLEFAKGRRKSGLLLVGAAAVSAKIPGFGTVVSAALRAYRRLR